MAGTGASSEALKNPKAQDPGSIPEAAQQSNLQEHTNQLPSTAILLAHGYRQFKKNLELRKQETDPHRDKHRGDPHKTDHRDGPKKRNGHSAGDDRRRKLSHDAMESAKKGRPTVDPSLRRTAGRPTSAPSRVRTAAAPRPAPLRGAAAVRASAGRKVVKQVAGTAAKVTAKHGFKAATTAAMRPATALAAKGVGAVAGPAGVAVSVATSVVAGFGKKLLAG